MESLPRNDDHILESGETEKNRSAPKLGHIRPQFIQPLSPAPPADAAPANTTEPGESRVQRLLPASPSSQSVAFPPGEPLLPTPGIEGPHGDPRQWAYPVGYNIGQRPRVTEVTSFEQLRNLAALYDGIQLCERACFDILARLEPSAIPRPDALEPGAPAALSVAAASPRIQLYVVSFGDAQHN